MIYTSYYAKVKKFPENMIPVAISRGIPKWYEGVSYPKLAPLWNTVSTYKNNVENDKDYWENWDNNSYNETVLSKLNPQTVAEELQQLVGAGNIPVLLCYEKSSDFCHRSLAADWFEKAQIQAKEATEEDFECQRQACIETEEYLEK